MELTFFHKNVTKAEEKAFVDYVAQKISAIESLLTKFAEDAAMLKVSIEKFDKHTAFQVEFCLILPTKTLVATEVSHQINKAVDLSKDRILAQIKKHIALLRKDRSHRSVRNERVKVLSLFDISEEVI